MSIYPSHEGCMSICLGLVLSILIPQVIRITLFFFAISVNPLSPRQRSSHLGSGFLSRIHPEPSAINFLLSVWSIDHLGQQFYLVPHSLPWGWCELTGGIVQHHLWLNVENRITISASNGFSFYHDMQISWPDSGSPPIRLSDS